MYMLTPRIEYSKYNQELLSQLILKTNENDSVFFSVTLIEEIKLIISDYALFLAFYEKYLGTGNTPQIIHIGETCNLRFASYWDHVGYLINMYFHEYMHRINKEGKVQYLEDGNVSFAVAVKCIKQNNKADKELSTLINKLKKMHDDSTGLISSRNISAHRYHQSQLTIKNDNRYKVTSRTDTLSQKSISEGFESSLSQSFKKILESVPIIQELEKKHMNSIPHN